MLPIHIVKRITDNHQRRHGFGRRAGFANDIEEGFMEKFPRFEHLKQADKLAWIEGIAGEIGFGSTATFFNRQQVMIRMVEKVVENARTQIGPPPHR